ncbi:P2R1A-PPP2R2A-interacting phosphatase regulator 1 isoform X3 [Embiotoca jacksoni]|uniref:P2R1A-PPP2R2A-interacting phosphatase regulator 1 isoform X3 n=1 Tax=Embiotoca jacksoni TaxID=100190 RepID=UPI0037041024
MERMEVDQCAGAAGGAGGGGALRRSNSAPMITSVRCLMLLMSLSDGMTVFSPVSSARYRRSSVSINPSCPSQLVSPFSLTGDRLDHKRQWFPSQDSGVTPNSSPSPTRRFRPAVGATVRWPALTPLKRKGGVESDGPPKKLFVAGVTDPTHRSSYTVSVSQSVAQSPPAGGVSPQSSPLSVSPPPSFAPFISHQHPRH